jgi:hypothetical protein
MGFGVQAWAPFHPESGARTLNRIRPRSAVMSGTALGLIAGAAVYGTVSPSAVATTPSALKAAQAPVAAAVARTANCAKGQKLEHGFCIIHIVRTVVVAHPVR